MAESVSIKLFGDDFFRRKILAMRFRAADMSPVLRNVGELWTDIIEDTFASEGVRILGHRWRKLQPSTISRRGSAHPILVDSAEMLIEMTGPESVRVSDDSVTLELPENVETKAVSHQFGYHNALTGTDVPARPMIGFTPLDRRVFRTMITDYLTEGRLS